MLIIIDDMKRKKNGVLICMLLSVQYHLITIILWTGNITLAFHQVKNTIQSNKHLSNQKLFTSSVSSTAKFSQPHSNGYLTARNIRAEKGHDFAIPFYRTLLEHEPNDWTASSRIAAAHSSPTRQDALFSNFDPQKDSDDIAAFRLLLEGTNFDHENIQRIFGIKGDQAFASGPTYIKPVMAGAALGLPPPLLSFQEKIEDENYSFDKSEQNEFGLCCLVSMFLLGFAVPESVLMEAFQNPIPTISLLKRLHFICPCELNPSLLIPYVQLFPMDLSLSHMASSSFSSNSMKSLVFVTDWHPNVLSTTTVGNNNEGAVMYIGPDSIALVQHLIDPLSNYISCLFKGKTVENLNILDFCSGSGIQAISALALTEYCFQHETKTANIDSFIIPRVMSATCFDINERALRFIQFNACINGFTSQKDIFTCKANLLLEKDRKNIVQKWGNKSHIILANPPFIPVPRINTSTMLSSEVSNDREISKNILKRYGLFSSGGPDGENVLREIISLTPRLLDSSTCGILAIVSEFMNPSNSTGLMKRMKLWHQVYLDNTTDGMATMEGILFTNEFTISSLKYALRRANDEEEYELWCDHMNQLGIEDISPGLLFLQTEFVGQNLLKNDNGWRVEHILVPKSNLGSIWTPHNKYAVQFTSKEWKDRIMKK